MEHNTQKIGFRTSFTLRCGSYLPSNEKNGYLKMTLIKKIARIIQKKSPAQSSAGAMVQEEETLVPVNLKGKQC